MDEARLFSVVCSDGTRSNTENLEYKKIHSNMPKNFTVKMTEHWSRLPIGFVESPLEMFKTHLDTWLCDLV